MLMRAITIMVLALAGPLAGCTAVGVATTVVGAGVSVGAEVVETGVEVGVGTTRFVAGAVLPDGDACEAREDYPEDEDNVCEGED